MPSGSAGRAVMAQLCALVRPTDRVVGPEGMHSGEDLCLCHRCGDERTVDRARNLETR